MRTSRHARSWSIGGSEGHVRHLLPDVIEQCTREITLAKAGDDHDDLSSSIFRPSGHLERRGNGCPGGYAHKDALLQRQTPAHFHGVIAGHTHLSKSRNGPSSEPEFVHQHENATRMETLVGGWVLTTRYAPPRPQPWCPGSWG